MIDWSDVPYFLAVAESGTLAGAASKLSVNHSTVYRRINILEEKVGARLFDRNQEGYSLTETGASIMKYARDAENSIHSFSRTVAGKDHQLSGRISITAPSSLLATDYLVPCVSQFCKKHPDIRIDIIVSDEVQDLTRGDADLALRVTRHPPESLIGRKICQITWDVYASKSYIQKFGQPKSMGDLENHKLIGSNGSFQHVPVYNYFNELYLRENFVCSASDLFTISALSSHGMGVVVLPSNFKNHKLIKLFKVTPSFDEQLWILVHPDLRHSARISALCNFLHDYLVKQDFRDIKN